MNEEDSRKTDSIAEYLFSKYPESDCERERDMTRGLNCYYINMDGSDRLILKITDECIMDNDLESIKQKIESRCIPVMTENINKIVVLFNDFHVEIRELE